MRLSPTLIAEARRILILAWPVMLTSFNWTLLQATDLAVVGLTGTEQVAYLGASRALTIVAFMVAFGTLSGVLVFAARVDGANDLAGTGAVLHDGLLLGLVLGVASGGILFAFAAPVLAAIGVQPDIAPGATRVAQAMALAFPFQLVSVAAGFFLEGVSRPRRVMTVHLATLPINAVLAWALSGGHLGLPALGAVGAGLATAFASALGAGGMLAAAFALPDARERAIRSWRPAQLAGTIKGAARLLRFGIIPGISSGLELAGFAILIALSTQLGEVATHAFQLVFAVHNITFGIALGFGSAAGVRAGNAVGEGDRSAAKGRILLAAALAALTTGVLALLLIVAAGRVVGIFPSVPEVHLLARAMLIAWAPFILFDGVQVVLLYGLRSLGDQVVAGANSILAYFIVAGGAGILLVHSGHGPLSLALASGLGMVSAALLHGGRLAWISARIRPRS